MNDSDADVGKKFAGIICYMACACAALTSFPERADAAALDDVLVTATRIPEPADQIPAAISAVSGKELRDRGATDMATALSLVSGVEAPSEGTCSESAAVSPFWGLPEVHPL